MRGAFVIVTLLVISLSSPISSVNAEEITVPEWVKSTVQLWGEEKISHEEFVNAIEFLMGEKIIELSSSPSTKELLHEIDYLQAKADVFKEEVKQLRDENEEYRIYIKSQELNSGEIPKGISQMFDENQKLLLEIEHLRNLNKHLTKQIDNYIEGGDVTEYNVSGKGTSDDLTNIEAQYKEELDNLKQANIIYEKKINDLKSETDSYLKKIDLLNSENNNQKSVIDALRDRNQDNRNEVNELLQQREYYENIISNLEKENFEQKEIIVSYKNDFDNVDERIVRLQEEKSLSDDKLIQLQTENQQYLQQIKEMQGIIDEQNDSILSASDDSQRTHMMINSLNAKIVKYEGKMQSLEAENAKFKNIVSSMKEDEDNYKATIAQLKAENQEQRDSLLAIAGEAEESNEFVSSLNSKLAVYKNTIKSLEDENSLYKDIIAELESENSQRISSLVATTDEVNELNQMINQLNSKIIEYENTIKTLENKNSQYEDTIEKLSLENDDSEYDELIQRISLERKAQIDTIMSMKVELDESRHLVNSLNEEIVSYENSLKTLENENVQYKTTIEQLSAENNNSLEQTQEKISDYDSLVSLLKGENQKYESMIASLKDENRDLESKVRFVQDEILQKQISEGDLLSQNQSLMYEIELLESELSQNEAKIKELIQEKDQLESNVSQPTTKTTNVVRSIPAGEIQEQIDYLSKQNESYLVELNYLTAKTIVNEEEIEALRAENEEYRVLINLLKKDGNDVRGMDSVDYDKVRDESSGQGVVIYSTFKTSTKLPDQHILDSIDMSHEYLLYVEPTPKWSIDVNNAINGAIKFWETNANVKFKMTESTYQADAMINWAKKLPNGYDGYVVDSKLIQIGLGTADCDDIWRPYSSKSVENVLIHELGHVLGLKHSLDKDDLMYPMIHNAQFSAIEQTYTLKAGESAFVRGCSFGSEPTYMYDFSVDSYGTGIDFFFVPSEDEYNKFIQDKPFNYYKDSNCIGVNRSGQLGVCSDLVDTAGMLIIAPESMPENQITVKVTLEER